jgi:hypothetical protein
VVNLEREISWFWFKMMALSIYRGYVRWPSMKSKTPTRLELHRLKFQQSKGKEQLLLWDELTDAELGLISRDFFSRSLFTKRQLDPYSAYADVLSSWGVMCPHPPDRRQTVEMKRDTFIGRFFVCGCCGSRIMDIGRAFYPTKKAVGTNG